MDLHCSNKTFSKILCSRCLPCSPLQVLMAILRDSVNMTYLPACLPWYVVSASPISIFFPVSYCRYHHCRQLLLCTSSIFRISIPLYRKLSLIFSPSSPSSYIYNPLHSTQRNPNINLSTPNPTLPTTTPKMCIPQISLISSPTPSSSLPPHRRRRPPLGKPPLSVSTSKTPSTNYITISPKIIYRAPPPSPKRKRSVLPPTHRRSSASKCEGVEFRGGYVAGREDARVKDRDRDKEKERLGVLVEEERRRGREIVTQPSSPPPPPPPPPSPSVAFSPALPAPSPTPALNAIQPTQPSPSQQPPASAQISLPRQPYIPIPNPQPRRRHRSHSHSYSSSSSSSSSTSSRTTLRALQARINLLWDRVNGLEQWRGREARRREGSWERRRGRW